MKFSRAVLGVAFQYCRVRHKKKTQRPDFDHFEKTVSLPVVFSQCPDFSPPDRRESKASNCRAAHDRLPAAAKFIAVLEPCRSGAAGARKTVTLGR